MQNLFLLSIELDQLDSFQCICDDGQLARDSRSAVIVLGSLYGKDGNKMSAIDVCHLYAACPDHIEHEFDGVYSVVILDFLKKAIWVYQDFFGSNQYIYIYQSEKRIVLSNSLKRIITTQHCKWTMNEEAAKEFLSLGYCPGSQTLIKQIQKIPGKYYLYLDAAHNRICFKEYQKEAKYSGDVSTAAYDQLFEKICFSCCEKTPSTTISKGYDSNFILHQVQKTKPAQIDSYCIGTSATVNEIPDAEIISKYYGNIKLHTLLVDGNTISHLPEIMYALDFSLYECGIFLQYALGNLLKHSDVKQILLGECADQILNYNTYHPLHCALGKMRYHMKHLLFYSWRNIHCGPHLSSYEMGSYIIIKKNGIMANYFGYQPEYPYIRKPFIQFARRIVKPGKQNKQYHKRAVAELLPDPVAGILQKMPGTTDRNELFTGNTTLEQIKKICEGSKYYRKRRFNLLSSEIDYCLKVLSLELFRIMYLEAPEQYLCEPFKGHTLRHFFPSLHE